MSDLMEPQPISGFKVYGQQMYDFTVQGEAHKDFGTGIAIAALSEASAIETEANAFSSVLRARQTKLSELGEALAILSKCIATLRTKDQESTDKTDPDSDLWTARSILNRYGVYNLPVDSDNKTTRGEIEKARTDTEYAMDVENNDMQQDMITVQGLVSKRDNSFSTASKVLQKVNSTGETIINTIGN